MKVGQIVAAASIVSGSILCAAADVPKEPYRVTLLADATFGEDGQLRELQIVDEDRYSKEFIEGIRARLAKARIPPVTDAGKPATFETGVAVVLNVVPGEDEGKISFAGLRVEPRTTRQYAASYPRELAASGEWSGMVTAICIVSTDGICSSITTDAVPGVPESARRFAKASMEGWEFKPQRLNGRPVEGQVKVVFDLRTESPFAENFRAPLMSRVRSAR